MAWAPCRSACSAAWRSAATRASWSASPRSWSTSRFTEPVFLTWDNWQNIIRSQAVVLTLAAGMTFVILTGGIDLSIASMTVGSAMVLGLAIENGAPWWLGCLAGIGMASGSGSPTGR